MWELVLSQVSIEWRAINTYIHGLLYVPGDPLCLPICYSEALRAYWVSCRVTMMVYGGWGPEMFLQPVPDCSAWFPYVFLWIVDVSAFIPVYDPTFWRFVLPVLRGHEKGFDGIIPFEMHLDPQVVACPFEPFPTSVAVWYHYGDVFAIWPTVVVVVVVGLVSSGCLTILGVVFMVEFVL